MTSAKHSGYNSSTRRDEGSSRVSIHYQSASQLERLQSRPYPNFDRARPANRLVLRLGRSARAVVLMRFKITLPPFADLEGLGDSTAFSVDLVAQTSAKAIGRLKGTGKFIFETVGLASGKNELQAVAIDAICLADAGGDPRKQAASGWNSLTAMPNHFDSASLLGHSTFCGAASQILTSLLEDQFGDQYSFTSGSVGLPGRTRRLRRFRQAANAAGSRRIQASTPISPIEQARQWEP